MNDWTIYQLRTDKCVRFAAKELQRCIERATRTKLPIERATGYDPKLPGLWLGLSQDFGDAAPPPFSEHPFDDEIFVDTNRKGGIIAGGNPRSVLLAVYRFLTEQGFRWVRPGKDGELIP
ncbi:MAG: hypothetical protein HY318_05030, partial [Armatimonadetes bacterium]|nr:hypothetical protein [Armatimonadota bacterium]